MAGKGDEANHRRPQVPHQGVGLYTSATWLQARKSFKDIFTQPVLMSRVRADIGRWAGGLTEAQVAEAELVAVGTSASPVQLEIEDVSSVLANSEGDARSLTTREQPPNQSKRPENISRDSAPSTLKCSLKRTTQMAPVVHPGSDWKRYWSVESSHPTSLPTTVGCPPIAIPLCLYTAAGSLSQLIGKPYLK